MIKRVESIDALRGLTIFMMVLCAAISWDAGLPAWMFHCQTPPPDYAFHPEVRGLTWVDMVFPLFIFSMGAAFPLAMKRKLAEGKTLPSIILYLFKRCAVLVAFAIALGNATQYTNPAFAQLTQTQPVTAGLFRGALWLVFFAALVRTRHRWINWAGWIALVGMMFVMQLCLGVPFNISYRDEIIMILAHVALLGGLVWLITIKSFPIRALIWLAIVCVRMLVQFLPEEMAWASTVGWIQYMIIAIPASMVGDMIVERKRSMTPSSSKITGLNLACSTIVCTLAIFFQLLLLYLRLVMPDLIGTAVLALAFFAMTHKDHTVYTRTGNMGFFILLCGILWDFVDGGLAKEYCNLSYLLVSCGISALTLCVLMWLESKDVLPKSLSHAGQNPMIAYTIAWFVITPLLYVIGFMGWFDNLCHVSPLLGLCRGLIVTFLMLGCTCLFTKYKIFWRS